MLKIGVDIFYKNIFTWFSWSADFLETSEETKFVLSNLNVAGKRIVDIRTVGGGWDTRTRVRPPGRIYGLIDFEEELLYKCAISLSDKERNGVDLSLWFDLRFSHLR